MFYRLCVLLGVMMCICPTLLRAEPFTVNAPEKGAPLRICFITLPEVHDTVGEIDHSTTIPGSRPMLWIVSVFTPTGRIIRSPIMRWNGQAGDHLRNLTVKTENHANASYGEYTLSVRPARLRSSRGPKAEVRVYVGDAELPQLTFTTDETVAEEQCFSFVYVPFAESATDGGKK